MNKIRNMKLFPKIFIYTFTILSFLIILTHIIIYFAFQKIYLDTKQNEIRETADKLSSSIQEFSSDTIKESLKLFSKNNDIKVFIGSNENSDELKLSEDVNIANGSKYNSVIIEEKKVKTKDNIELILQFVFTKDVTQEARNISLRFLPYTLILSFIFSIIISYIYTKIIIKPIFEITKITDKMINLEKDARLDIRTKDEIGNLNEQINTLYVRLLNVIENLDKKNKEIIKFEKTKVDFLRSTSHELKTPLASLKIILENMKYNVRKI